MSSECFSAFPSLSIAAFHQCDLAYGESKSMSDHYGRNRLSGSRSSGSGLITTTSRYAHAEAGFEGAGRRRWVVAFIAHRAEWDAAARY